MSLKSRSNREFDVEEAGGAAVDFEGIEEAVRREDAGGVGSEPKRSIAGDATADLREAGVGAGAVAVDDDAGASPISRVDGSSGGGP